MRVFVFRNFVRALTRLHAQEADNVIYCLCEDKHKEMTNSSCYNQTPLFGILTDGHEDIEKDFKGTVHPNIKSDDDGG